MVKLTTDEFIKKSISIHGDKYIYDKSIYNGSKGILTITCRIHGDYEKSAGNHTHKTNPQGCPYCALITQGVKKSKSSVDSKFKGVVQPYDYKIVPISGGNFVKVDNEDFTKVKNISWSNLSSNYAHNQKNGLMHRLIMNCPADMCVDHINGDTYDNRKINLRICTHQQNMMNTKIRTDSSSSYKGIYYVGFLKKWAARISFNGNKTHIGVYRSEIDAAKAYDTKAKELFGEFARVNFP